MFLKAAMTSLFLALLFCFFSCTAEFEKPKEGALITCRDTSYCPTGWVCKNDMCVKSENLDCDSNAIMTPLIATGKCPLPQGEQHGRGNRLEHEGTTKA